LRSILHKCASLPWVLRLASLLSLTAAGWAIYKIGATPEGGGLPYFLFWTPLFLGISIVLLVTSFFVRKDINPIRRVSGHDTARVPATPPSSKLNVWVNALLGIGILALLGEGIAIFSEGKSIQALELLLLCAGVVAFCVWKQRLAPDPRRVLNILTVFFLVVLGLAWWWILDLILAVFDR
jgi:hypothetical protein